MTVVSPGPTKLNAMTWSIDVPFPLLSTESAMEKQSGQVTVSSLGDLENSILLPVPSWRGTSCGHAEGSRLCKGATLADRGADVVIGPMPSTFHFRMRASNSRWQVLWQLPGHRDACGKNWPPLSIV